MNTTLYCIACEEEVFAQNGNPAEFVHETYAGDYDVCEFPDGWATCPPPEFDMDEWIKDVTFYDDPELQRELP